ncbi:MAG: diheme cytochrome c-553 [Agriterribacter sp.]
MRPTLVLSVVAVLFSITIAACNDQPQKAEAPQVTKDSLVKRGEYLVAVMGCDDCHSPKKMGARGPEVIPELRFSGFQQNNSLPPVDTTEIKKGWAMFNADLTSAVGPWGASYAANISSDESGIGNWSLEQFGKALREGKFKGLDNTRPLLPPMPWSNYTKLADHDLEAIYTYLKSTNPVKNTVPSPTPISELK